MEQSSIHANRGNSLKPARPGYYFDYAKFPHNKVMPAFRGITNRSQMPPLAAPPRHVHRTLLNS